MLSPRLKIKLEWLDIKWCNKTNLIKFLFKFTKDLDQWQKSRLREIRMSIIQIWDKINIILEVDMVEQD